MKQLILFSRKTDCAGCTNLKAALAKTKYQYKEFFVDTNEGMIEAQKYRVMSVPTLLVMEEGRVLHSEIGYSSKTMLNINSYMR